MASVQLLPLLRSPWRRWRPAPLLVLAAGLLAPLLAPAPGRAAEELRLQLDGLELPIDLVELEAWARQSDQNGLNRAGPQDLAVWLNLLEPGSRRDLARLLKAPLLRDRSFGVQLLNSWTGEQMLREAGTLLTITAAPGQGPGRSTAPLLLSSLRQLLQRQSTVSTLELLRALPAPSVTLRIDGVLELASQWRRQVQRQNGALAQLRQLPLPERSSRPLSFSGSQHLVIGHPPQRLQLAVPHRVTPLPLELWPSQQARRGPWVLLMPGLGGSPDQLSWLAAALADRGWPVLVVEHPGSDQQAIQASLLGDAPPPGAETLPQRLADLQAVLDAQREGQLPPLGPAAAGEQGVVLMGHSLGGLAALMGAGLVPERGLGRRCELALASLPLTNLSRLLQCQLPRVTGDGASSPGPLPQGGGLLGVVAFNGFGSLLWPYRGLEDLNLPVLLVGGGLDLVTPPEQEQLGVFARTRHPRSRLVLVEGASHFSPVRIENRGEALFRLGQDLVGIDPIKVQALLLSLTSEFLQGLEHPLLLSPQRRDQDGVRAYVLDPSLARRWRGRLPAP